MSCIVENPLLGKPHGGGGHHGGGHHGGHHPARTRRQFRNFNAIPEFEVVRTDTCRSWGFPAPMQPDLDFIGKQIVSKNGGQPASAYYNGDLYLFSYRDGVIRAQPCTSMTSTLGDAPGAALLYYLYYKTSAGWTPVGKWMALDESEQQMTSILSNSPVTQISAYVWDGKTMTWKFF